MYPVRLDDNVSRAEACLPDADTLQCDRKLLCRERKQSGYLVENVTDLLVLTMGFDQVDAPIHTGDLTG